MIVYNSREQSGGTTIEGFYTLSILNRWESGFGEGSREVSDHSIELNHNINSLRDGVFRRAVFTIRNPSVRALAFLNINLDRLRVRNLLSTSTADKEALFFELPIVDLFAGDTELANEMYVVDNRSLFTLNERTLTCEAVGFDSLFVSDITDGTVASRFQIGANSFLGQSTLGQVLDKLSASLRGRVRLDFEFPSVLGGEDLRSRVTETPISFPSQGSLNSIMEYVSDIFRLCFSIERNGNSTSRRRITEVEGVSVFVTDTVPRYKIRLRSIDDITPNALDLAHFFAYEYGNLYASPSSADYDSIEFSVPLSPAVRVFSKVTVSLNKDIFEDTFRKFISRPSGRIFGNLDVDGTVIGVTHFINERERTTRIKAAPNLVSRTVPVKRILQSIGRGAAVLGG